jgi:MYXO-CTERM domain-containing protein
MVVQATRGSGSGAIDAYALFNFHLGSGGPTPGTDAEQIAYDSARDAFFEWGPSGVAFGYGSVGASSHHGASPNNPYNALLAASNLADNAGTGGATTDAVAGLQTSFGDIAIGAAATAGWFTVLAPDAQAGPAVDRVRTWINGRDAATLLAAEITAWRAWVTPPPSGGGALEATLAKQSQVTLRMGQVTESGAPSGQILASVAPGKWNIAWVRDMAYATVALAKSGHLAEAKAALAFQMQATVGAYQQYVGVPYQISVVRYFGNGTEESDMNADGPNVEFDGFGLFLWALDEYVAASNDTATLATWWPIVKAKIADVLVHLQEASGLIAPDSSIWEVHWNGKQRHFAYTSITAANGLCAASRLAAKASDSTSGATYLAAGQKARDALLASLRAPDGTLGQSTEGIAGGTGWLDAAVVEAINFGLVDPTRRTARASLATLKAGLVPPSGRGFMRSDVGDWYSSQEWIFVDLRSTRALALHGDATSSSDLFAWNVAQASENFRELSELHDRVTADYAGESPMVGFGAGAYLLALLDRGKPAVPTCVSFASEPADPVDAGSGDDGGPATADGGGAGADGGVVGDGGSNGDAFGGGSNGCSCDVARRADGGVGAASMLALALVAVRRRRRA